jgi:hypothetical protein
VKSTTKASSKSFVKPVDSGDDALSDDQSGNNRHHHKHESIEERKKMKEGKMKEKSWWRW